MGDSCGISKSCVEAYVKRAKAAGLGWPLPEELDDEQLERMLFKREATLGELKEGREQPCAHASLRLRRIAFHATIGRVPKQPAQHLVSKEVLFWNDACDIEFTP